ncbi:hypothetical protein ACFLY6_00050 [Candidatus Dependentiae bacterium]
MKKNILIVLAMALFAGGVSFSAHASDNVDPMVKALQDAGFGKGELEDWQNCDITSLTHLNLFEGKSFHEYAQTAQEAATVAKKLQAKGISSMSLDTIVSIVHGRDSLDAAIERLASKKEKEEEEEEYDDLSDDHGEGRGGDEDAVGGGDGYEGGGEGGGEGAVGEGGGKEDDDADDGPTTPRSSSPDQGVEGGYEEGDDYDEEGGGGEGYEEGGYEEEGYEEGGRDNNVVSCPNCVHMNNPGSTECAKCFSPLSKPNYNLCRNCKRFSNCQETTCPFCNGTLDKYNPPKDSGEHHDDGDDDKTGWLCTSCFKMNTIQANECAYCHQHINLGSQDNDSDKDSGHYSTLTQLFWAGKYNLGAVTTISGSAALALYIAAKVAKHRGCSAKVVKTLKQLAIAGGTLGAGAFVWNGGSMLFDNLSSACDKDEKAPTPIK